MSSFDDFFRAATGWLPYRWQRQVATQGLPEVLEVGTGLGKTEGAALAWAWRKLTIDADAPLHLVYCLPMRSLVRQTIERLRRCFARLGPKYPEIQVYSLMGGTIDEEWERWPEKPWVLVGTQDQLLSRALNRGYEMSRFKWPVHFGLLNQDCHWIVDEVQLMGPGLWTTAQLDWMRRKRFAAIKSCRTTWMSATAAPNFLATTDRITDGLDRTEPPSLSFDDPAIESRRNAVRRIAWAPTSDPRKLANLVRDHHVEGTLSLVIGNTVRTAREIFQALPNTSPKLLLTSQFRGQDREMHERRLLAFDERRAHNRGDPIPNDPGLICVSTQVVEAGVDISAFRLWSELPPWPCVVQRLGRLNRDGRNNEAMAWFWRTPQESRARGEKRIGPYDAEDVRRAQKLLDALIPLSDRPFAQALADLSRNHGSELATALAAKPEPMPRAFDVHGLFATEPDLYGGFTDVSSFVRGTDPDADLTVFWRTWDRPTQPPPRGDRLDGPLLDLAREGCSLPFHLLRDFLRERKASAWIWSDDEEQWKRIAPKELRAGMVVLLPVGAGGYDAQVGWTGRAEDRLTQAPPVGTGHALRAEPLSETGYWVPLSAHLDDARREAEALGNALKLTDSHRIAVVEASRYHDIGKAHPLWQDALPAAPPEIGPEPPWAKGPFVLAVDALEDPAVIEAVSHRVPVGSIPLEREQRSEDERSVLLRWAVSRKSPEEIEAIEACPGVRWAGYRPFRPDLRHEAATALAMWKRWLDGSASYPALSVYLAAAHHGKVRTVLRSWGTEGDDVFGVTEVTPSLLVGSTRWPLEFSVAKDGAPGKWTSGSFELTGFGWTGLVADLLGSWLPSPVESGVLPDDEPRGLGPFALAYLEALVRVADWRASENPCQKFFRP